MEFGGVGRGRVAFVAGTLLARPLVKASELKGFGMSRALAIEPFKAMVMLDLVIAILTEGLLCFVSLFGRRDISKSSGMATALALGLIAQGLSREDAAVVEEVDSLDLRKKRGEFLSKTQ
jgi:hypothetical protein